MWVPHLSRDSSERPGPNAGPPLKEDGVATGLMQDSLRASACVRSRRVGRTLHVISSGHSDPYRHQKRSGLCGGRRRTVRGQDRIPRDGELVDDENIWRGCTLPGGVACHSLVTTGEVAGHSGAWRPKGIAEAGGQRAGSGVASPGAGARPGGTGPARPSIEPLRLTTGLVIASQAMSSAGLRLNSLSMTSA